MGAQQGIPCAGKENTDEKVRVQTLQRKEKVLFEDIGAMKKEIRSLNSMGSAPGVFVHGYRWSLMVSDGVTDGY